MINTLDKWVKQDSDAWAYHTDAMDRIREVLPQIVKVLKLVDSYADNGEEIDKAMRKLKRVLEQAGETK